MSWETWSFAFSVTVPNLLMMLLGILLRHWRLMDNRFIDGATKLVFNLALPCLLFFSIATNHPQLRDNFALVMLRCGGDDSDLLAAGDRGQVAGERATRAWRVCTGRVPGEYRDCWSGLCYDRLRR